IELCHELIDWLEKEAKEKRAGGPAAMRTVVYAAGSAEALEIGQDALLAQTILSRAVTLNEARTEAKAIIDLARRLGLLRVETVYGAKDFRVNVSLQLAK